MDQEQAALYARIRAFDVGGGRAALTFGARLARENGWTEGRAGRIIEEYKKFVFLAVAAGHPVSPSEAVDQAWHLHLTYTRSYWDALCGQVLRKPLHHEPTKGGPAEQAKHAGWYRATLASYRRLFGHAPPRDIWPDPEERWRDSARFQWVDLRRRWVLPRPPRSVLALLGLALLGLVLLPSAGCVVAERGFVSPLDLGEPELLRLYFASAAVAFSAAWLVRWRGRGPGKARDAAAQLDVVAIAYLHGGASLAADTAIGSLVDKGALEVDPAEGTLRWCERRELDVPPDGPSAYRRARPVGWVDALHPLERAAYELVGSRAPLAVPITEVQAQLAGKTEDIDRQLVRSGLVTRQDDMPWIRRIPALVALTPPALGLVKIAVGVQHDRPVGILVIVCLATAIAACALFMRRPPRTRRGDAALADLRRKHASLQSTDARSSGQDAVLGMAVFGLGVLAGGPLSSLSEAFQRAAQPSSRGCGSGCAPDCGI